MFTEFMLTEFMFTDRSEWVENQLSEKNAFHIVIDVNTDRDYPLTILWYPDNQN